MFGLLLNPTVLKYGGIALVILGAWLGLQWWGHTKYAAGQDAQIAIYTEAAKKAEAENEAIAKVRFREAERGEKTYAATTEVRIVRDTKLQNVVDDQRRDIDLLRWAIARRSETPIDPASACAAERGRIRVVEGLLGESQQDASELASLVKEGDGGIQRLAAKLTLAKDWIRASKLGDPDPR